MRPANVPRPRIISVLASSVTVSVFETTEGMSGDEDLRRLTDEIVALLSSPLAHMLPAGRAGWHEAQETARGLRLLRPEC